MRRFFQVQDEVAFTASTFDLPIPFSPYFDNIALSLRYTTAVAAVLTATGLLTVNPLEVKLNNSAITSLRGDDAFALSQYWYGATPLVGETTAVGSTGKIQGIPIPVWGQPKHGVWSTRANFAAQTNVSAPVISLEAEIADRVINDGYLSILTSFFTPASTGAFNQVYDNVLPGDLLGVLFFGTTVPTFAADTVTVREVQAYIDGVLTWQEEWKNLQDSPLIPVDLNVPVVGTVFGQGFTNFLQNYAWWETRDDPVPAKKRLTFKVNSDIANALRIIPVIRVRP